MTDLHDLHDVRTTLEHFAQNIDAWRADVARLRAESEERKVASTELLVRIEDTSGEMYREIDSFNAVVADVAKQSPEAAGQLAEVGEELHLLLLDITELGTALYSTRSADVGSSDEASLGRDPAAAAEG